MEHSIVLLPQQVAQAPNAPFEIKIVDSSTGQGIPLAELETVNHQRFISDSAGIVAFDEPGLMGRKVFFNVFCQGYSMKKDRMGYEGIALDTKSGGIARISLDRLNVAERVCRLTGQGIYRDSAILGRPVPLKHPVIDGDVFGQDTAQAEMYRGKMMWFWGDTDCPDYPLGNFHTSGAVASYAIGQRDASRGLDYEYFKGKNGFVRGMVPSTEHYPIWVSGLAVLGEGSSQELYAYYAQMFGLNRMKSSGLMKWDDAKGEFQIIQTYPEDRKWRFLDGHTVQADGYVMGNDPPNVRVPASEKSFQDAGAFEAFTCLDESGEVKRVDGKPDYRWQKTLGPINSSVELRLVKKGKLSLSETHFSPVDPTGKPVRVVGGSVHWNAHRKKWIGILAEQGGTSELGEIWYSESDAPTGPFRHAVKVVSHKQYSFYNPVQHAFLDVDGGKTIYFEGTYTAEFSGNPVKTPLYNYNQILYRLNLDDPRLAFAETP